MCITLPLLCTHTGTCCISDFSLAVTSGDSDADHTHRPEPDYRYLAPEFLAEPAATPSLENLKKADMYSYGLVLWEIARRCTVLGEHVQCMYTFNMLHSTLVKPTKVYLTSPGPSEIGHNSFISKNHFRPVDSS